MFFSSVRGDFMNGRQTGKAESDAATQELIEKFDGPSEDKESWASTVIGRMPAVDIVGRVVDAVTSYVSNYGTRWGGSSKRNTWWQGLTRRGKGNYGSGQATTKFFKGALKTSEYHPYLQGTNGVRVYDRMQREDGQVGGVLDMLKQPIKACRWFVDCENEEVRDFLTANLGLDRNGGVSATAVDGEGQVSGDDSLITMSIDFERFIRESITCLEFGFSLFEKTFELRSDGKLHLRQLGFRPQVSIDGFNCEDQDPDFRSVEQVIELYPKKETINIPREQCVYFGPNTVGHDYWGMSVLRRAYMHWFFKSELYQIDGIAHDRFGVGVPYSKYPPRASDEDLKRMGQILKNLSSHEQSYVQIPGDGGSGKGGWEVGFLGLDANGRIDPLPSIEHHNNGIAKSVLVLFMDIGSSQTGSRATSMTLSDVFYHGLVGYVNHIKYGINRQIIAPLLAYNYPGVEAMVDYNNLRRQSLTELSTNLSKLGSQGFITPDRETEEHLRGLAEMPTQTAQDRDNIPNDDPDNNDNTAAILQKMRSAIDTIASKIG